MDSDRPVAARIFFSDSVTDMNEQFRERISKLLRRTIWGRQLICFSWETKPARPRIESF